MTLRSERLLQRAERAMSTGQLPFAIELLRQALTEDPDDGIAHALLALCLLSSKRLHAAKHEAGIALAIDPSLAVAHFALGKVALFERRTKESRMHLEQACALEPETVMYRLGLASYHELFGKKEAQQAELERALALDPDDPAVLADLAEMYLERGDVEKAERYAREGLEIQPEHYDCLVAMGHVLLRRGRIDEAREHAIWALSNDAQSDGALRLMAAIKSRQSWFLGLWWRYNTFMGELGTTRSTLVLLLAFGIYRVGTVALQQAALDSYADLLQVFWIALCIYSWVGPGMFRRVLQKEIGKVKLAEDF